MNAGAHAVIIVDNIDQPNVFLMTDGLSGSAGAQEVIVPSILINRTMGEHLKLALLSSEDDYIITLRPARGDEFFAEEEQFYQTQNTLAVNIPFGTQGLTKDSLTEAVLQQLSQMQIKLDGQFQIQYMDANNQPTFLTVQSDANKFVAKHSSPLIEKLDTPSEIHEQPIENKKT